MYLGWDVGIKNLAYCLINDEKKIIDWGIVNLSDHQSDKKKGYSCDGVITVKSKNETKTCGKKAKFLCDGKYYCKIHSKKLKDAKELSDKIICSNEKCEKLATKYHKELSEYYCNIHARGKDKTQLETINQKNVARTPLLDLSRNIFDKLSQYSGESINSAEISDIVIENQPVLKNPTMKSVQMVLFSYFISNEIKMGKKYNNISLMTASNKLKVYKGPIDLDLDKIKGRYMKNKKLAVEHTLQMLKLEPENKEWYDYFINNKGKRDDLSDAFLMTRYYISKNDN